MKGLYLVSSRIRRALTVNILHSMSFSCTTWETFSILCSLYTVSLVCLLTYIVHVLRLHSFGSPRMWIRTSIRTHFNSEKFICHQNDVKTATETTHILQCLIKFHWHHLWTSLLYVYSLQVYIITIYIIVVLLIRCTLEQTKNIIQNVKSKFRRHLWTKKMTWELSTGPKENTFLLVTRQIIYFRYPFILVKYE